MRVIEQLMMRLGAFALFGVAVCFAVRLPVPACTCTQPTPPSLSLSDSTHLGHLRVPYRVQSCTIFGVCDHERNPTSR